MMIGLAIRVSLNPSSYSGEDFAVYGEAYEISLTPLLPARPLTEPEYHIVPQAGRLIINMDPIS
jgi:hypothetical protein